MKGTVMLSRRTSLIAALATVVGLASAAPAAHALTLPTAYKLPSASTSALGSTASLGRLASFPLASGGAVVNQPNGPKLCGASNGAEGQAPSGGNEQTICGFGLTYVGPATSIQNVVGATIISPGFVGTVVTSTGNVAVGGW
jgi:hypothetical protein